MAAQSSFASIHAMISLRGSFDSISSSVLAFLSSIQQPVLPLWLEEEHGISLGRMLVYDPLKMLHHEVKVPLLQERNIIVCRHVILDIGGHKK
ncbi:hypothetical protein Tco_1142879, partial [Tanacetum coccineum]